MSQREALAFPKPVRLLDPGYRRFIRRQPCVVCGAASEHAHIVPKGWGKTSSKVSDYRSVPLCRNDHRFNRRSLHAIGRERFEDEQRIDLDLVQIQYLETYISALKEGEDLGAR